MPKGYKPKVKWRCKNCHTPIESWETFSKTEKSLNPRPGEDLLAAVARATLEPWTTKTFVVEEDLRYHPCGCIFKRPLGGQWEFYSWDPSPCAFEIWGENQTPCHHPPGHPWCLVSLN